MTDDQNPVPHDLARHLGRLPPLHCFLFIHIGSIESQEVLLPILQPAGFVDGVHLLQGLLLEDVWYQRVG